MISGYLERALNYIKNDSNNSRKRNSRGMNRSDDDDYIPVPKRLRTGLQGSEVTQSSTWGSSIVNKLKRCGGFFSHIVGSVAFNRSQQNRRAPNMESGRRQRNWEVKNANKSVTKPSTLTRNPLQQSQQQYYNPFSSGSSNITLPEIINLGNDDDNDDDDCVEIATSEKLIVPDYNAIYNSEEENYYPSKIKGSNRKNTFLSLSKSILPKVSKKSKKRKLMKTRHLYCPSMLAPAFESFRQDEKEKYNILLELQQSSGSSSYSSFQEANLKLAPKLAHRKTVSVQTEKKNSKTNAFFKVNLTDSDKIHQIEKIEEKRPLEATSWDKKARASEHVFQILHPHDLSQAGTSSKSYTRLPLDKSRGSFSVRQESFLKKTTSMEPLTHEAKSTLNRSSYKPKSQTSNFINIFSESPLRTTKREYSVKSGAGRASVYDKEFFSEKWLNELRDNVDKSSRTQSQKAQHEELKYQILQEDKLAKQFEANRKSLASIESKFSMTLSNKYDESEDEDSYQLPELTPEMQKEIDFALRPNPPDEVLVQSYGIKITRKDMETLSGLNWLNDEIINFYTNLMMERGKNENYPSCYAFNTFFYPKLISSGHSALKRWTRKIDIFAHDLILIPVHLGMHWCLAVIDFRHKKIQYYDSMGGQNNECLNALKNYLQEESMDKKNLPYDTSDWKLEPVKNIPQQMNGSDCGMFTCKFAEYITRKAKITFSQKDMPYFRRLMVYEIVNKKLM